MTPADALRKAMQLAREQRSTEALMCLEDGLRSAKQLKSSDEVVVLLLRNAAVISVQVGNLREAVRYYHEASLVEPQDPYTHLALGDVYKDLGNTLLSEKHWDLFEALASSTTDPDLKDLLERHVSRRRATPGG